MLTLLFNPTQDISLITVSHTGLSFALNKEKQWPEMLFTYCTAFPFKSSFHTATEFYYILYCIKTWFYSGSKCSLNASTPTSFHTLTRSSFIGGGSRRPLIWVTMGPSTPGTIMVSPSLRRPLIKITSMVVPMPGSALTWTKEGKKVTLCFNNYFFF